MADEHLIHTSDEYSVEQRARVDAGTALATFLSAGLTRPKVDDLMLQTERLARFYLTGERK